jgi:hypothetical protein
MMEKEQYVRGRKRQSGMCVTRSRRTSRACPWTADPKKTPYRDCMKNMTPNGWRGILGMRRRYRGGLHHPEHGGRSGVWPEDAEGSGERGAEEGGAADKI